MRPEIRRWGGIYADAQGNLGHGGPPKKCPGRRTGAGHKTTDRGGGNRRAEKKKMGGCASGGLQVGSQIREIDVWAQAFAAHDAAGFAVDGNGQRFAAQLPVGHIFQMRKARSTTGGKGGALAYREREPVGLKVHSRHDIHRRVNRSTPAYTRRRIPSFRAYVDNMLMEKTRGAGSCQQDERRRDASAALEGMYAARRAALKRLIDQQFNGNERAFALKIEYPASQINDMRKGRKGFGKNRLPIRR